MSSLELLVNIHLEIKILIQIWFVVVGQYSITVNYRWCATFCPGRYSDDLVQDCSNSIAN